jgi:hypothetical protein
MHPLPGSGLHTRIGHPLMATLNGAEEFSPRDTFDSREVIERIDWLENYGGTDEDSAEDEKAELDKLSKFANEARGYVPDWEYGETFISDSYFKEYAEELAYDLGFISREATWPLNSIDWEAAADDLKTDYISFDRDRAEPRHGARCPRLLRTARHRLAQAHQMRRRATYQRLSWYRQLIHLWTYRPPTTGNR